MNLTGYYPLYCVDKNLCILVNDFCRSTGSKEELEIVFDLMCYSPALVIKAKSFTV